MISFNNQDKEVALRAMSVKCMELTYAEAIATLFAKPDPASQKLLAAKFEALKKSFSIVSQFKKDGIDQKILDTIMQKKANMILEATAIKDVMEIASLPKPFYDGNEWLVSKYAVPEEELVLWSNVSLYAPLTHEANLRYMELFKNFYGKSVEELLDEP